MKWLLVISLAFLIGDDPPRSDTVKYDTIFIAQQEMIQDNLDSLRLSMETLKHKIDSASKK